MVTRENWIFPMPIRGLNLGSFATVLRGTPFGGGADHCVLRLHREKGEETSASVKSFRFRTSKGQLQQASEKLLDAIWIFVCMLLHTYIMYVMYVICTYVRTNKPVI